MYGSDYIGSSAEVVFPITAIQGDIECTNITIVDDDALECDHSFFICIVFATNRIDITDSSNNIMAVVKILDNDSKYNSSFMCHRALKYNH